MAKTIALLVRKSTAWKAESTQNQPRNTSDGLAFECLLVDLQQTTKDVGFFNSTVPTWQAVICSYYDCKEEPL